MRVEGLFCFRFVCVLLLFCLVLFCLSADNPQCLPSKAWVAFSSTDSNLNHITSPQFSPHPTSNRQPQIHKGKRKAPTPRVRFGKELGRAFFFPVTNPGGDANKGTVSHCSTPLEWLRSRTTEESEKKQTWGAG